MHRRTVLKGAGSAVLTGIAGCLGQAVSDQPDNSSQESPTSTAGVLRRVKLSGQDSLPEEVDATLDVEVVESAVTEDHTATVRVTFTNTGPKQEFMFGDLPPFTVTKSVESNPGVLLLDPDKSVEKVQSECWQPTQSSHAAVFDAVAKIITLDSGERISRTAELWGSSLNEKHVCLPTGTFRFEREYTFGFSDTPSFTWGFSVSLSTP